MQTKENYPNFLFRRNEGEGEEASHGDIVRGVHHEQQLLRAEAGRVEQRDGGLALLHRVGPGRATAA